MYEFIFLGLIPGIHFQVTFSAWLLVATAVAAWLVARRTVRSRIWQFPNRHGKFAEPARRQMARG